MTSRLEQLAAEWLNAKAAESDAIAVRRGIEDQLIAEVGGAPDAEGTRNLDAGEYAVKVVARLNRKVDGDALQTIAAENHLSEHLGILFRWKPEINLRAWQDAAPEITAPLAAAITTTPGRPSFTVTKKEEE